MIVLGVPTTSADTEERYSYLGPLLPEMTEEEHFETELTASALRKKKKIKSTEKVKQNDFNKTKQDAHFQGNPF